jgi:hypothetical protein
MSNDDFSALSRYRSHPVWAVSLTPHKKMGFESKRVFHLRWGAFEATIENDLEMAAQKRIAGYWVARVEYGKAKRESTEWYTTKENAAEWARQAIDDWDNENRGNKV